METLETSQTIPLSRSDDGTIRLADTGVSLDSIVLHFNLGATAEEIAQKFPPVELADVYAAITYYLTHREVVEEYLRQQELEGDKTQAARFIGWSRPKLYRRMRHFGIPIQFGRRSLKSRS